MTDVEQEKTAARARIEELDAEIAKLRGEKRDIEFKLASLLCPYRPGQRLTLKQRTRLRVVEVLAPIPGGYDDHYSLNVRPVRKDSTLGEPFTVHWFDVKDLSPVVAP